MLITTESATALDEFKSGVRFWRDGHPADALEHFRRAAGQERQNPYYLSFLGLCTGLVERNWEKALELCRDALLIKRTEVQLHLNLVEVYMACGRVEDAVRALDAAEVQFGADARFKRYRRKLGRRRKPVIDFLDRGHVINRKLGRIRHRLFGSLDRR